MAWAWKLVCARFINFRKGRKFLTLLSFGCPAHYHYRTILVSKIESQHHHSTFVLLPDPSFENQKTFCDEQGSDVFCNRHSAKETVGVFPALSLGHRTEHQCVVHDCKREEMHPCSYSHIIARQNFRGCESLLVGYWSFGINESRFVCNMCGMWATSKSKCYGHKNGADELRKDSVFRGAKNLAKIS